MYGQTEIKGILEKSFPAIIDTGSSTIGVPAKYFDDLKKSWEKDVGKIDCDKGDFCEIVGQSCESLNKNTLGLATTFSYISLKILSRDSKL